MNIFPEFILFDTDKDDKFIEDVSLRDLEGYMTNRCSIVIAYSHKYQKFRVLKNKYSSKLESGHISDLGNFILAEASYASKI